MQRNVRLCVIFLFTLGLIGRAALHQVYSQEDDALMHRERGIEYYKEGHYDAAIIEFEEAIRQRPSWHVPYHLLGIAYVKTGQLDAAIASYEKAIQLKPDFAAAHYNLGTVFGEKGQLDAAIASLRKAIHYKPDYAKAHYILGRVYLSKDRHDIAISSFRRTIRYEPDHVNSHYYLGWSYAKLGDRQRALDQYRWLQDREPALAEKLSGVIAKNAAKSAPEGHLAFSSMRVKPSSASVGSRVLVDLDYTVSGSQKTVREERRIEKEGKVVARFSKTYTRVAGRHQSRYGIDVPGSAAPGAYTIVGSVTAGEEKTSKRVTLRVNR